MGLRLLLSGPRRLFWLRGSDELPYVRLLDILREASRSAVRKLREPHLSA